MFKASLENNNSPELGTVTVEFPIPEAQYEETIRALNGIQSGAVVEQDCFVADIGNVGTGETGSLACQEFGIDAFVDFDRTQMHSEYLFTLVQVG